MPKSTNYYYDQLNKDQQKAYYAMKQGLLSLQDSFAVPMLTNKELSDILMVNFIILKTSAYCKSSPIFCSKNLFPAYKP